MLTRRMLVSAILAVCFSATGTAQVTFTDVSDSVGAGLGVATTRGISWVDFNNDHFEDLFVPTSGTNPNTLFMSNGNGTFTEVAAAVGLNDPANTITCSWADFDNDGDLDLVTTATSAPTRLWRNNRETGVDTTFASIEVSAGIAMSGAQMAVWADYNKDGFVDFYSPISNSAGSSDALYRNNGNSTFTNVAESAGVNHQVSGLLEQAVHWGDYDGDRDPDLFIGNLQTGGPSFFHRNNGNGIFSEIAGTLGFAGSARGSQWVDFNNDGLRDFSVAGYAGGTTPIPVKLYRNNGNGTFTDVASSAGLSDALISWGVTWADVDDNGYEDLFVAVSGQSTACQLYANNGDGTFTNVTSQAGLGSLVQLSGAWGDYDNDGDMDLYTSGSSTYGNHLFRNNGDISRHWLKTRLIGTVSNRAGIGAAVIVRAGALRMTREVNTGVGYRSQNMLTPHFGLAGNLTVDSVIVIWPSGITSTITSVAADQTITIMEQSVTAPHISVNRDTIRLVTSSQDSMTVRNTGNALLVVDTIIIGPGAGRVSAAPRSFSVPPGDSASVLIYLSTTEAPPLIDTASLYIYSNDPEDSVLVVPIVGTGIDDVDEASTPGTDFWLTQNYPNPFNPSTRVEFRVRNAAFVELKVFDVLGREVKRLVEGNVDPGEHTINWDGTDNAGRVVAAGIYLCRLRAAADGRTYTESRKITFIK